MLRVYRYRVACDLHVVRGLKVGFFSFLEKFTFKFLHVDFCLYSILKLSLF